MAKRRRHEAAQSVSADANPWVVTACGSQHFAADRQFSYRLSRANNAHGAPPAGTLYLDALVLANGICVLTYPLDGIDALTASPWVSIREFAPFHPTVVFEMDASMDGIGAYSPTMRACFS